jgi:hypothetical protein
LQLQQKSEVAMVLAVIGEFLAELERLDARVVGELAVGDGGEDGSGGKGGVRVGGALHFELEVGRLHTPEAEETPAGRDHVLDEGDLKGIAGLELVHEGVRDLLEAVHRFSAEEDADGVEVAAVTAGVLGGDALALRSAGSSRFRGVGAVGLDLTFSCHGGPRVGGESGEGREGEREGVESEGDFVGGWR